jgi:hypothetical protein
MLRVFMVTSPMSVGSWILAGYVPLAGVAAASSLFGKAPRIGMAATAGSALLGPAVASYTAALTSDTAVPAWHDGYLEMPFVFVGSGATAAAGLGLLAAPVSQNGPSRAMAVFGVGTELAAFERMERRVGMTAETLLPRPWRRLRPRRQDPVGDRPRRGTARQAQPSAQRGVRRGADGRVGRHPVGNLPRRHAVGDRPQIHDRSAARTAAGSSCYRRSAGRLIGGILTESADKIRYR